MTGVCRVSWLIYHIYIYISVSQPEERGLPRQYNHYPFLTNAHRIPTLNGQEAYIELHGILEGQFLMVAITFGCPHSPSIGQRLDTRTLEIIECVSLNVIYTRFLERNRSHSTNDAKHHEESAFYYVLKKGLLD